MSHLPGCGPAQAGSRVALITAVRTRGRNRDVRVAVMARNTTDIAGDDALLAATARYLTVRLVP